MTILKVIIHEVHKQQGTSGAVIRKSKTLLDVTNSEVQKLINELDSKYRKRSNRTGLLDKENPTVFHEYFIAFHKSDSDENFILFSQKSAENLRDRIDSLGSAKGGYLVFAHYHFYRPFCAVFFVRDTTSIAFKRNSTVEAFDLDKVEHIDIEKLAMACRINMEDFEKADHKYLTFIQKRGDQFSQYFVNWISTKKTSTSEADTKNVLAMLKTIPFPEKMENIVDERTQREALIRKAHNFINGNAEKRIKIDDLSKELFDDKTYLPDYAQENYPNMPNEFKAHTPSLKDFLVVRAVTDGIELRVDRFVLKDRIVRIDKNDPNQVIINSEEIASQIREGTLQ